jgi:hypothetical protein
MEWSNFVIHAERSLMNELKEFDIQASLREFYSSAQMNVAKIILMNLVN